jgi:hypothetical protein
MRRAPAALVLIAALAPRAYGQSAERPGERQTLGTSFTIESLADLPSASTIFSLLDSSVPELISDRIDAGSLTVGQPARMGAHGSSWTQTMFRIDGVDISDPNGSGTPLAVPPVIGWQRMDVATGALPMDVNAAGPVISLTPVRPGSAWTRSVEFYGAPSFLLSRTETTVPPAIARLDGWTSATLLASGPLKPGRLGAAFAGTFTNSRHYERADPTRLADRLASFSSHFVYTPDPRDEVRTLAWFERTRSPYDHRIAYEQPLAAERATSLHLQSVWDTARLTKYRMSGFTSFSLRRRTTDVAPVPAIITERLEDGPVTDLVEPFGTDSTWSIGARLSPVGGSIVRRPNWRALQGGIVLSHGGGGGRAPFGVRIGETIDGTPARAWSYSVPTAGSDWHETTLALYAGESFIVHPRVIVDAGLRFEAVGGGADSGAQGISWHDWYPSGGLRWEVTDYKRIAALVRFNRYGHRLPLRDLAYGEATSPAADVYRWAATGADPTVSQLGALIARVGPGTGADPLFSVVDPGLERPYVNELTFGLESRPSDRTLFRLMGIIRHEGQLMGVVDTGVPIASYAPVILIDPGVDHGAGQTLVAYNRKPASFGADQYVLTNPAGHHATFASAEISWQTTINRLFMFGGLTAGRSEETSANRGFRASENDAGLLGEVFTNPNAETNARGRPFTERGYTIKTAGVYRFTEKVRLGLAARYQDGQHFARLLLVPDLNQGTEAIRAFVNGKTRFTYTLTVDARLQKTFALRDGRTLAGVIDVYNALNTRTEIEESAVTGPLSRTITAVQPPRSIHLGFKYAF